MERPQGNDGERQRGNGESGTRDHNDDVPLTMSLDEPPPQTPCVSPPRIDPEEVSAQYTVYIKWGERKE